MRETSVARLLPALARSRDPEFNVFDVMHHGTHEKQISNVFRWLLNPEGHHNLGDAFVEIFIDEVNRARLELPHRVSAQDRDPLPHETYWVSQEVNVSGEGETADIADLVLMSRNTGIAIENYFSADGHGHNYARYLNYAQREGRNGAVVLLCREATASPPADGWASAAVVTYSSLIDRLYATVTSPAGQFAAYGNQNPDAYGFICQMYRKFGTEGRMGNDGLLDFVVAMCDAGEAGRYQIQKPAEAAQQFANDLAELAVKQFGESRELLKTIKAQLKQYCTDNLTPQLNQTLGQTFVRSVSANYAGIYQWSVNFDIEGDDGARTVDEAKLQIKFGPSAWYSNEQDPAFMKKVERNHADYSHLFITRTINGEIRQSSVAIQEVLTGLKPDDRRLHDEIVELLA
jgi:hypothetical protein